MNRELRCRTAVPSLPQSDSKMKLTANDSGSHDVIAMEAVQQLMFDIIFPALLLFGKWAILPACHESLMNEL